MKFNPLELDNECKNPSVLEKNGSHINIHDTSEEAPIWKGDIGNHVTDTIC